MSLIAHYRDEFHEEDCEIITRTISKTYQRLEVMLDGILFYGWELEDFELADANDYEKAGKRFSLLKYGNVEEGYYYLLQKYTITVDIPVIIIENDTQKEKRANLYIELERKENKKKLPLEELLLDGERVYQDDIVCHFFQLKIGTQRYYQADRPEVEFASSLRQIQEKIKENYLLKCCFTCLYADYSIYGNGSFGTLRCYEEVCKQTGKNLEEMQLIEQEENYLEKQETQVCNHYQIRLNHF